MNIILKTLKFVHMFASLPQACGIHRLIGESTERTALYNYVPNQMEID